MKIRKKPSVFISFLNPVSESLRKKFIPAKVHLSTYHFLIIAFIEHIVVKLSHVLLDILRISHFEILLTAHFDMMMDTTRRHLKTAEKLARSVPLWTLTQKYG